MFKFLLKSIFNYIVSLFNPKTIDDYKAEAANSSETTFRSKEDLEMELSMMDAGPRVQIFKALEAYKTNNNPNIDELKFLSLALDIYYKQKAEENATANAEGPGFWGYAAMGTSLFESILSMPVHWQIGKILAVEEVKANDYMKARREGKLPFDPYS